MALHPLQLPSEAEKEANLFADCGQREQVKPLVVRTSVCVCLRLFLKDAAHGYFVVQHKPNLYWFSLQETGPKTGLKDD